MGLNLSPQELSLFDGQHGKAQLLIAVKGAIYDVSGSGSSFYSPGSSYHIFAGKEVARALALMSTREEDCGSAETDDLTERQREVLRDWVSKFRDKYPVVGFLKNADS